MSKRIDLTGQKYNKLLVIGFSFRKRKHLYWNCICDCGQKIVTCSTNLRRNHTTSCGCTIKEKLKKGLRYSHGMTRTRFYNIWRDMRQRCSDENSINYERYGGRGIKVCDRWSKFENFRDDMYHPYSNHVEESGEVNTSIERINNNGNYCKENCKWATLIEQGNNKRNNIH